jgi:peptidoglycan hydrolase CwlO-like protein
MATRGKGSRSRRAGGLLVVVAVIAGLGPVELSSVARADTKSDLASAKARLSALTARIAEEGKDLGELHVQLNILTGRVAVATTRYQRTVSDIARTRGDLRLARSHYEELRAQLDARAAATYMGGAASFVEIVLGATSYTDFTDRLAYANSMSRADATLSQEVQRTATELERKQQALATLQANQGAALLELQSERRLLAQRLADQQAALGSLAGARAEATSLVEKLRKVLGKEELLAAVAAVHGGLPIPFGQWAPLFLPRLGAPTCRNNLVLVVAWEATEYTMARFNPLATSYVMPGSTLFNSAVRNYISLDQGITATVLTLESTNPAFNYGPIVANLRACSDPLVTANAINHSAYCTCTGSYPLTYLVPFVKSNYSFYANICTGC